MIDMLETVTAALADRYTIVEEIGKGGMATVYLADDPKHRRKVAIKVLRPDLAASLTARRFLNEIEMAAGLAHPNIVPVYDSGAAGGLLYFVMPFIDGESLHHRLYGEKRLSIDEAVRVAHAVAGALSYAHRQNIVHRDIKPGNILFVEGLAMVADFGIGKAMCDACGEEIVIPIDLSSGASQEFVEDCPVCCRPNIIRIEVEEDGGIRAWGTSE